MVLNSTRELAVSGPDEPIHEPESVLGPHHGVMVLERVVERVRHLEAERSFDHTRGRVQAKCKHRRAVRGLARAAAIPAAERFPRSHGTSAAPDGTRVPVPAALQARGHRFDPGPLNLGQGEPAGSSCYPYFSG